MAIYKDIEPLEVIAYQGENEDFDRGVTFILEKLDGLPAADVVEVVRCKDCKKRDTDDCPMGFYDDTGECFSYEEDDWYCSCGERNDRQKKEVGRSENI